MATQNQASDGGYYIDPKTGVLMQGGTYTQPTYDFGQYGLGGALGGGNTSGWSGGRAAANQPSAYKPKPYVDPMTLINPKYTQAQPYDALAPMKMYQDYMNSGQVNAMPSSYHPFTPPAAPISPPSAQPPSGLANNPNFGGK